MNYNSILQGRQALQQGLHATEVRGYYRCRMRIVVAILRSSEEVAASRLERKGRSIAGIGGSHFELLRKHGYHSPQ